MKNNVKNCSFLLTKHNNMIYNHDIKVKKENSRKKCLVSINEKRGRIMLICKNVDIVEIAAFRSIKNKREIKVHKKIGFVRPLSFCRVKV